MKKLFIILLLAFAVLPAIAQHGEPFIQVGMNLSTVVGAATEEGFRPGVNAGIMTDYFFTDRLFMRLGVAYSMKGARETDSWTTPEGRYKDKATLTVHYVEVPVAAGMRFPISDKVAFSFHAGPYFAVGVNGKVKYEQTSVRDGTTTKYKQSVGAFENKAMRRADIGLNFGGGIHTKSVYIGLQYGQGVYPLTKDMRVFNGNLSLNLGFYL